MKLSDMTKGEMQTILKLVNEGKPEVIRDRFAKLVPAATAWLAVTPPTPEAKASDTEETPF